MHVLAVVLVWLHLLALKQLAQLIQLLCLFDSIMRHHAVGKVKEPHLNNIECTINPKKLLLLMWSANDRDV